MMRMTWSDVAIQGRKLLGRRMALTKSAEDLKQKSNDVAPIEEAILIGSSGVDVDEIAGTAVVAYDTPYAVFQHEVMDLSHDAGRQAKYLEQPLNEHASDHLSIIATELRKVFT